MHMKESTFLCYKYVLIINEVILEDIKGSNWRYVFLRIQYFLLTSTRVREGEDKNAGVNPVHPQQQ